jgi:tetratricopeptide (TPR) repeat protein
VESFDKALEINSKNPQAWAGKGSSLGFLKQYQEAIECMERFIDLASALDSPQVEEAWAMILEWKIRIKG